MKSNASLIYSLILVVGDFLALVAAFVAAYVIRGKLYHTPVAHPITAGSYADIFLALLPFWILFFALLGLYSNNILEKRFAETGRLLIGSFVGLLFVASYAYADNNPVFPSKLVPVYGFILGFLFLLIFRNSARAVRIKLYSHGTGITNLLIVGNTKIASELVASLANPALSGYRIVGVVGTKAHSKEKYPHIAVFDSFDEATAKLPAEKIHSIVQTELFSASERNDQILEFAQTNHISYRFVPGNSELFVGNIAVELFRSSVPVIAVHQTALIGWGRIIKRLFDILAGGILLIIASPFMLIIALLILLFGGRGGVFFRQTRLTRFNNQFRVFKFRTAKAEYNSLTHAQAFAKMGRPELLKEFYDNREYLPDDPRYSRIGLFLRKTSLDELPQLFNVIKGDLSLVGPRALIPQELSTYEKKHSILSVKSGVTGLAQISGRKDLPFAERRKLDIYYVQNWSLWLDIVILVKTVRVVVSRTGAK
ncbi:MAG TPA: sugar transferase [Candidatus Saccharimonadales bacterium]|nr:sugar transferase [Candidatus Saccharimonadales bacterium]